MLGATNMEDDYDVSVKASEGRHIDQHYYHHHRQDLIETEAKATDNIPNDDDENNHSNNNAVEDSHDGDDLIKMTENNMKSESDENGPNMHVGTPSKLRLDSTDPLRPRRKKARRACYACQRAHLTCGDERPCQRCIKRGLADVCQDGIRKKAKYLHDAPPDALRPVLGPYYKSNFNQITSHGRLAGSSNNSITRDNSNSSPTITTNARMSSIFSLQGTPQYPVFNQSNSIPPPLQTRISINNQKSSISPPFNHQTTSIQSMSLPPQQISPSDPQRGSYNTTATLLDPSNLAFNGFDLESLNFGNHYGALEFGILGHMSSGVDEVSLKDQASFMSVQGLGEVNLSDNNIYGDSISNCNQIYQNDLMNYGNVAENQIFSSQSDLQHAYAIAAGSQSQYSPSTDASSSATGTYENSPINTFTPNSTSYTPTPKSLKPAKSRLAGSSGRLGFGSNLQRKRSRDSSFIYDSVQEPYPYTTGFHNLTAFLQRRFSPTETFRIAKSLASIRPSFISCMKTLTRQDLIFMEKCFQRTLFEYESFMHNCCTPTIVCRRTGEITAVNQEFIMMTGWRKEVLLGKEPNFNINTGKLAILKTSENTSGARQKATFSSSRTAQTKGLKINTNDKPNKDVSGLHHPVLLAELMDVDDVIEFYQDFARLAFNDSRGSIMSRCKLLKYITREKQCNNDKNNKSQSPDEIIPATTANASTIPPSDARTPDINRNSEKNNVVTSINSKQKSDLTSGADGISDYGLRELNGSSSFERNGKLDCCYCWTVKRDVFDIPMMIILNRFIGATTRKPHNASDVFTAFYSTIFAAAALADSKAKENRLHEWDRLIEEAREGQWTGEERNSCLSKFDRDLELLDSLKSSIANVITSKNSELDHDFFGRPEWHLRKSKMIRRGPLCMQSVFGIGNDDQLSTKDNFSGNAGNEPVIKTFIHEEPDFDVPERDISQSEELNALRVNINGLVIRLLQMSTIYESPSINSGTSNDEEIRKQLEIMKQRLESLNVPFNCLPIYIYEGTDYAKAQVKDLNAILWCICRKATCEESSINLMIAKICYNLLISAVPPNIETYNIIFHEFSLLELHELAEQVLQSFWFSRLRPNKRTIELIILHYKNKKDKIGLTMMVRKMRGSSGDLMQSSVYAKKYQKKCVSVDGSHNLLQNFNPQDPMIRRGMKRQKFYFRSGYLYKKSPRDKHIFDALINAHLELKGLRPAIRYMSAAIREGSKIKANTLCLLIISCIKYADFTSGLKILMNILSQWTLNGYHKQIQLVPVIRFHIYRLLFFCGIDPNKGVYGHLPSRITRYTESMIVRDIEFPKEALRKLLYLMKFESLKERLSRNSELIVNLGNALNIISTNSKTYNYEGIEKASHLMKNAAKRETTINHMHRCSLNSRSGFKLRLRGLQSNYITSFSKMEEITTKIIMTRVRMCALRLNVMANMISHTDLAGVNMHFLQNLDLRLSILHIQVKVEIYLNKWWIRRLGFVPSLSRSCTQRKRLNRLIRILTDIESKSNTLWDYCFAEETKI